MNSLLFNCKSIYNIQIILTNKLRKHNNIFLIYLNNDRQFFS